MFKGRIGRLAYFLGFLYLLLPPVLLLVLLLAAGGFSRGAHTGLSSAVSIVVLILDLVWLVFFLIAGFGLIIRRWHDLNQSGWLALLQLVPVVSFICLLVQLFAPGTKGSNTYGDRAESSLGFKAVVMGTGSGGAGSPDPHFAALTTQAPAAPAETTTPAAPPPVQPQTVQPASPAPIPPTPPATPPTQAPEQPSSDQPQAKP